MPDKILMDINLATLMISTTALGIILGFAIALLQIMSQQTTVSDQNKQLKKLRTEINSLRHSGLEDISLGTESTEAVELATDLDKPIKLGG